MEMDDELQNFIREHKARVAEDKATLEQDPPYMEMRSNVRRVQDPAVKENIPPSCRTTVQGKEESLCMGLPLGVDYAKKKQRLQQELRMDFRRYMAEKKRLDIGQPRASEGRSAKLQEHLAPHPPSLSQGPRNSSHAKRGAAGEASGRDAAPLAEVRRTTQRANRPRRCRTSHREGSDEEPLDRGSGNDDDDGGGGGGEERLEPAEGRQQQRHTGVRAGFGTSSSYRANGEKRETPTGGARADRRSRLTNRDQPEFATGLLIGAVDAEEVLRKRQEHYRQELEAQIADQQRRKRREKELELELRVAAAGAMDPEKQLDHIKYMGLNRRREVAAPAREPYTGRPARENPPPEPVHAAFQSPLLEYSAALGNGLLSPYCQPGPPPLHRALATPRIPAYLPHPPAVLPEGVYRCHDACHYHGTRTALDPHHHPPHYGQQLPVTSGGFPASYWAVPPGGTVPQLGPHSQYSESHVPDPPLPAAAVTRSPMRAAGGAVSVDSLAGAFPGDRASTNKEKMLSYKEALKQQEDPGRPRSELYEQILERQERRRVEQEERERDEARLEADMRNHQPWGRGGGGAPLRDSTGNLLTDLHQMHKLNEEAYIHPEQRNRRAPIVAAAAPQADQPVASGRVSGFAHVPAPQFARGSVFANEPSAQQVQEQDKYKVYLKEQIEEKRRQKAEEREQSRLEEEREERKLAEQRARIQREFEEEQDRRKRKEVEQKRKNEELVRLAELRKKEEELAKRQAEEKENAELRHQYERERQARLEEQVHREPSPPIPTLQRRPPRYTPKTPTFDSQRSTVPMSERSLSGLQSPPVPACKNHLRATEDQRDVFSELSALRRQLRSEQRRLEDGLLQGDWEERESPLRDRLLERPPVDVFDMARLRLQAPVRRPLSRNPEPGKRIHDPLQPRPSDGEFRAFSREFPRVGEEERGVASQRRRGYRDQLHMTSSQRMAQDGYLDVPPPHHRLYQRVTTGDSARGSLLESDSAFIDPLGEAYPVPPTPEQRETPQLSARERRRLPRKTQSPQAASSHPVGQPDGRLRQSQSSVRGMEPGGKRAQSKTRRPAYSRHDNQTGRDDRPYRFSSSDDDDDGDYGDEEEGSSPQRQRHHASSWDSVADTLRPITSHRLPRREVPAVHGSAH